MSIHKEIEGLHHQIEERQIQQDKAYEEEIRRLQESIKARVDFLNQECRAFLAPYAAAFKRTGATLLLEELKKEILEREMKLCKPIFVGVGCEIEYFWPDPHRWYGEKKTHSSKIVHFPGEDFSGRIEEDAVQDSVCSGVSIDNLKHILTGVNSINPQGKYGFKFLSAEAHLLWRTHHKEVLTAEYQQHEQMEIQLKFKDPILKFGFFRTGPIEIPDDERNVVFTLTEDEGSLFRSKRFQLGLKYYSRDGNNQILGEKSFQIPEWRWGERKMIREMLVQAYVDLSPKPK